MASSSTTSNNTPDFGERSDNGASGVVAAPATGAEDRNAPEASARPLGPDVDPGALASFVEGAARLPHGGIGGTVAQAIPSIYLNSKVHE